MTPRLLLLTLVVGCSPAAVAPSPPPTPVASVPVPVAPVLARVTFPTSSFRLVTAVSLDGGSELRIGRDGRRALATKKDTLEEGMPLPEPIVAVAKLASGYALVAGSGVTYFVAEPLGPPLEMRSGPSTPGRETERPKTIVTTKGSIVIAHRSGVFRSLDGAKSWKPASFDPPHPGPVVSVAVDETGQGLALKVPQRIYATKDFGATWSAIDSLGLGARRVDVKEGAPQLSGVLGDARLIDGKLVPQAAVPAAPFNPSHGWFERFVHGGFVVELEHAGALKLRVGRVGSPLRKIDPPCRWKGFAGDAEALFMACDEPAALHRYREDGSFEKILDASDMFDEGEVSVATSSSAVWFGSTCHDAVCAPRKVSFDGKKFAEVKLDVKGWVIAVAFDGKHRGHVLVDEGGRVALFSSAAGSTTFTRTKLVALDSQRFTRITATADDDVLRVVACSESTHECQIQTFREGVEEPTRYLSRVLSIALVGARGMLVGLDGLAYETADGGRTWTLATFPSDDDRLSCSRLGCLRGETLRVGFGEAGKPLADFESDTKPEVAPKTPTPTKHVTCKPTGPSMPATPYGVVLEAREGIAWHEPAADYALHAKVAMAGKVRDVEMFGKRPKSDLKFVETVADGVTVRLAAKYPNGDAAQKVLIDLSWLPTPSAEKPVRVSLAEGPKGSELRPAAASHVAGGKVVSLGTSHVYFLDEKGHARKLGDVPPFESFVRLGKGYLAGQIEEGNVLHLSWSKSSSSAWRLSDYGITSPLGRLFPTASGPVVGFELNDQLTWVRVPATRAADPLVFDTVSTADVMGNLSKSVCTDAAFEPAAAEAHLPSWDVRIDGVDGVLDTVKVSLRPLEKGACGRTLVATHEDRRVFIPLAAPTNAWMLEREAVRPLSCTL